MCHWFDSNTAHLVLVSPMIPFTILFDDVIAIRPWELSDVKSYYEAVRESISELQESLDWCDESYSVQDSKEWIHSRLKAWRSGKDYSFAIESKKNERLLGSVAINQIPEQYHY